MLILVLESSTSSVKAMVYCSKQGVLAVRTMPYVPKYADASMQDAEEIFLQLTSLGKEICLGRKIDMIALSGALHSVMLCDRDMVPLTPVYQWSFTGAKDLCKNLRQNQEYVNRFYQKTGCMVNAIYPAFKLKYLQQKGYDLTKCLVMGQSTYNTFRLTGERMIMDSIASGTGLMNIHTKEFDTEILAEIGIDESQLSKIVTYKDTGSLDEFGASQLGLSAGIPVIPAGSDAGLNQVTAPNGVMTFSVGTSGALRMSSPNPVIPSTPSTWCYLSPKSWMIGAATSGCCNCVDWVKTRMLPTGTTFSDIEKDLSQVENTPVFLPFLFGERCPGWQDDRSAGFLDIKPPHKALDFYHSVLEGTLYNLYQCFKVMVEINGMPRKILLSGGILHSEYWTQMCADIFNMEMEAADMEHSSLLGAAALAMELGGVISDASDFNVEIARRIIPDPKMHESYMLKFKRYLELYEENAT